MVLEAIMRLCKMKEGWSWVEQSNETQDRGIVKEAMFGIDGKKEKYGNQ